MSTLFTKIINGELPGTFVYRDDLCVCFMTINPITLGHALVVPIQEVDEWSELSDHATAHIFNVARRISAAQKIAFACTRVGLVVAGYEIPHCHLHLIPSNSMNDFRFENAAAHVDATELNSAASKIISALNP